MIVKLVAGGEGASGMIATVHWRQFSPEEIRRPSAPAAAPQVFGRRASGFSNDEPSLEEIFADPIIMLLMERDGVNRSQLSAALRQMSSNLGERVPDARGLVQQSSGERAPMWRGELCLDPARHRCTWRRRNVDLTVIEFALIETLAEQPGYVKTRDQLIKAAYGHLVVSARTIDSHMKRLRYKFRSVDRGFAQIQTVWGIGYRYSEAARRTLRSPSRKRPAKRR